MICHKTAADMPLFLYAMIDGSKRVWYPLEGKVFITIHITERYDYGIIGTDHTGSTAGR